MRLFKAAEFNGELWKTKSSDMALQYAGKGVKVKKKLKKTTLEGPVNLSFFRGKSTHLYIDWVWRWHQPSSVSPLKCHKNHSCHYPRTKPSLSSLFSMIPSDLHAIVSFELAGGIVLCTYYPQLPPSIPHLFFSKRQQNSKDTEWTEDIKDDSGEKPPLVHTVQGL